MRYVSCVVPHVVLVTLKYILTHLATTTPSLTHSLARSLTHSHTHSRTRYRTGDLPLGVMHYRVVELLWLKYCYSRTISIHILVDYLSSSSICFARHICMRVVAYEVQSISVICLYHALQCSCNSAISCTKLV